LELHVNPAETPDEAEAKSMSKTLEKYRVAYEPSISASGRKSLNNGDDLAHFLSGMDPLNVITLAEVALGLEHGTLLDKYRHLNRGQQRMNAGNRIRAAIKRGDITYKDVEKAAK
jgi:hypothetical protein